MTMTDTDSLYARYDARLTGRCAQSRKLANNTYLERRGDAIAIRLHDTDVVTYHRDGRVVLNSGGWRTATTKDRIYEYSPCSLHQERGVWYVNFAGATVVFADGMTLNPDGTTSGHLDESAFDRQQRRNKAARRQIKDYLNGLRPDKVARAIENTGGDPWCCKMVADDGSHPMDHGCVRDHVIHKQFHGTLLYRAVKHAHYNQPDFIMSLIHADAVSGRLDTHFFRHTMEKFLRSQMLEGVQTR